MSDEKSGGFALPAESIDFNKLHDALLKGEMTRDEAVDHARETYDCDRGKPRDEKPQAVETKLEVEAPVQQVADARTRTK